MEKFFKRKSTLESQQQLGPSFKKLFLDVDLENLPADPGERNQMLCYHPNDRDEIRRAYLQKGPCQPKEHNFPQRQFSTYWCTFCYLWVVLLWCPTSSLVSFFKSLAL
jgi:hypothetical protein